MKTKLHPVVEDTTSVIRSIMDVCLLLNCVIVQTFSTEYGFHENIDTFSIAQWDFSRFPDYESHLVIFVLLILLKLNHGLVARFFQS